MQDEQEDYQNEFGNFEFPSQMKSVDNSDFSDFENPEINNGYSDNSSNVENPFDQFIPKKQQNQSSPVENPFDQFIPKEQPSVMVAPVTEKSTFNRIVDPIISGGDATAKGLRHAISAPSQFINPFIDFAAGTNLTGDLNAANQRMDEEYRLKHPNPSITEQTLSNVAEGLPALLAGGAGVSGLASKGVGGLANLALSGAASAPLFYDESGKLNPLAKTAIGGAAGTGVYGLGRLASLPAKAFNKLAGEISEPEVRELIEANKGLKTGIGDIIDSPSIKFFQENVLSHVPFSGVEKTKIKTANKLTDEGHNILNNLLGEEEKKIVSEGGLIDVGSTLQKSLKSLEEGLNKEKRELYSDVDRIAEDSGIKVTGSNYKKEANSLLNEIKSSREFGELDNTDKSAFVNFLKEISSEEKIGSLKSANLKISDLSESAQKEFIASNKFLGGAYNRLKKSLQNDLKGSIESSGDKKLQLAYEKAQKHYAENIAPFEDKDILKFTRKGADSDTLVSHFLKTGKNDRGNLLGKLLDKVGIEGKNSIAYEYFSPAFKDGLNGKEIMPKKMVQLYNKLGDKTKNKLFTSEFRKQMKTYGARVKTNSSAFDAMYNPKTGARLASILPAAEVAAALVNHSLIPPLAATSGSANLLNRGLNSEWIRNLYLKGYNPLRNISPIEGGLTAEAQDLKNQY